MLDAQTYPEDADVLSWHDNGLAATAPGLLALDTGIRTAFPASAVQSLLSPSTASVFRGTGASREMACARCSRGTPRRNVVLNRGCVL